DDSVNMSAAWLNQAHALFNQKDYQQALSKYNDFLRTFPRHPQQLFALFQAGLCYLRLDRPGDAVDRWEEITRSSPADPVAARAWMRGGDLYFNAGHFDDARRCYEGFLRNFTGSREEATGIIKLARCDYNEGLDEQALERFREVADRFPGTEAGREARLEMAQVLYRLGKETVHDGLLTELVESCQESPLAPEAQFEIGLRKFNRRDYVQAAQEFKRVLARYPGYSAADRAFFMMADSYHQAGATGDELETWQRFIRYFPDSELYPSVLFRLGTIHFDQGEYTLAAGDFSRVLEFETEGEIRGASLFNLAMSHRILGENDEAIATLQRYRRGEFENKRRNLDVARLLGEIYVEGNKFQRAAAEFQRALEGDLSPAQKTELHYRLGMCREKLGDTRGALRAYQKSMDAADKADVFRLSAVARFAALHELGGNYRGALLAYRDLIENASDPDLVLAARERAAELATVVKK
ncbi:MAG: tetratricopeptide repeat protein, partial [Candidatus Krumholzibacteriota bacterium]|nr:tetratricopeptide repeat protein [Candidatus Krumholzibacteriota bacterium]